MRQPLHSMFSVIEPHRVNVSRKLDLNDIVRRAHSYSISSPRVLGDGHRVVEPARCERLAHLPANGACSGVVEHERPIVRKGRTSQGRPRSDGLVANYIIPCPVMSRSRFRRLTKKTWYSQVTRLMISVGIDGHSLDRGATSCHQSRQPPSEGRSVVSMAILASPYTEQARHGHNLGSPRETLATC